MHFSKQQISQKIGQISQQRHIHDKALTQLQSMIRNNKKHEIVELRKKFSLSVQNLQSVVRENTKVLDSLSYRCEKLQKEGVDATGQLLRIESLQEYFKELQLKVKRQHNNGQEIISGRQRWELTKHCSDKLQAEEEQSLLFSNNMAKQTTEAARQVFENLSNQTGRLQSARMKMGEVLQSINLSGNVAQLLKNRTRQDNKLIVRCSLLLLVWIVLCLFVLKPMVRGY